MSSLSRLLLVSTLFCAQSLVACGGSSDSRGNAASAGEAGEGNDESTAGAGSHSAGASAGGRGNSAGAGPTGSHTGSAGAGSAGAGSSPAPSGSKLSEIKTDAQALAVCNRIKSSVSDADLKKMLQGSCAISGQTGAASQLGTCKELQADCAAHTPVPSTDDGSCTADDIPDCDNVTVDEYVACTRSTITIGIEYLSAISCETDLESLEAPPTASACAGPFARCPEFAAAYQ